MAGPGSPFGRGYRPPLPPKTERVRQTFSWQAVAVAAFTVALVFWMWQWLVYGWAAGSAIVVIPLLSLLSVPLFLRAAATERRFDLAGLMATGLALRFLASFYRMAHGADAFTYNQAGDQLAQSFRHFNFNVDAAPIPGTGGMKVIAGVVSVVTGENLAAKFLIFTWLGFLGCWLFYRAFVTALPNADHYRYGLLVFLWPTLLFWPSSIGKDCWMLLTLGLASLGAARVLVRKPGGYSLLVAGLLLGSFVRPHISLMALVGFAVALLVSRRRVVRPGVTPSSVAKVAGLVVLIAVGGVLVSRSAELLDVDDFSASSIDTALTTTADRTETGTSAFDPADPQTPQGYVESVVTILFRPFPTEADGTEQVATSLEALLLLGLIVASWRRLVTIPSRLRDEGYVTYAVVYLLVFFFAFGSIANFGILARQRSQAMPLVFVLLAVPAVRRKEQPAVEPVRRARPRP